MHKISNNFYSYHINETVAVLAQTFYFDEVQLNFYLNRSHLTSPER